MRDMLCITWWKIHGQVVTVDCLHVIVFRIHEKDTTTEIHFPNDTRASPSSVILATYWMGKQPILANEYLQMKQEIPLEECLT